MKSACIAAALSLAALSAGAAGKDPVAFSHNDWEVTCDNTRTCRAAGYQSESGPSDPVSMLITRAAGPGTAINIELQIGGEGEVKGPLRFKVGKATVAGLAGGSAKLDADQVRTILPELLKNDDAAVTGGSKKWTLSLAGLNAVLLKMDEPKAASGRPVRSCGAAASRSLPCCPRCRPPS